MLETVAGNREEYECLFYVALSRSQDRLLIYAPTNPGKGKTCCHGRIDRRAMRNISQTQKISDILSAISRAKDER
jgi:ATP-dependent exoDNAse (exonuclease V) beta subunit